MKKEVSLCLYDLKGGGSRKLWGGAFGIELGRGEEEEEEPSLVTSVVAEAEAVGAPGAAGPAGVQGVA